MTLTLWELIGIICFVFTTGVFGMLCVFYIAVRTVPSLRTSLSTKQPETEPKIDPKQLLAEITNLQKKQEATQKQIQILTLNHNRLYVGLHSLTERLEDELGDMDQGPSSAVH